MKLTIPGIAALTALAASPALAQSIGDIDTDGDGMVSMEEMTAAYPDTTADTFAQVDTNADGLVDESELTAAVDAGLIAPS